KDRETYELEMMAMIARVRDTHANLWSSLQTRPPTGTCQIPITVRFVEERAVITEAPEASGMKRGDTIVALDGVSLTELMERWKPYYAASNDTRVLNDMARVLTRGACGDAKVRVRRGSEAIDIAAKRETPPQQQPGWHDLPGDTFRRLSNDVA